MILQDINQVMKVGVELRRGIEGNMDNHWQFVISSNR